MFVGEELYNSANNKTNEKMILKKAPFNLFIIIIIILQREAVERAPKKLQRAAWCPRAPRWAALL